MIGSIGSSSMMSMMQQMQGARGGPPAKHDVDGSGGLNKTELTEAATQFEEMTGQVMDVEDVLVNYDSDGNGEIGRDEMKGYMKEQGFAPPPPPPMSTEMLLQMQGGDFSVANAQGYSAYGQSDETDLLDQLLTALSGESDEESSDV